jgi:hypothetical protein
MKASGAGSKSQTIVSTTVNNREACTCRHALTCARSCAGGWQRAGPSPQRRDGGPALSSNHSLRSAHIASHHRQYQLTRHVTSSTEAFKLRADDHTLDCDAIPRHSSCCRTFSARLCDARICWQMQGLAGKCKCSTCKGSATRLLHWDSAGPCAG